jgi:hypothetical protein
MCQRNASSVVDHIKDFIDAEGHVSWALFSDPANHQALCANCHNELTSKYDSGFGNARKEGKAIHIRATGDTGVQFRSSSMIEKVNAALPQTKAELDDLLSDIPD